MQEEYNDSVIIKKLKSTIIKPIKYVSRQSNFTIGIYILSLLLILVIITLLYNFKGFKVKSAVTIVTENFLNAIREGNEELIITYSNAVSEDFSNNSEFYDLLEMGNDSIHETIDSWFGSDGTRILDDVIGIGNKLGNSMFYQMMEYKIINYKEKNGKALVKVQMINLKTSINIELIKNEDIWVVNYRQYKHDFDNIILGSTAKKIFGLLNLNKLF